MGVKLATTTRLSNAVTNPANNHLVKQPQSQLSPTQPPSKGEGNGLQNKVEIAVNQKNTHSQTLQIAHVGKKYGKRWVVKDVSFAVEQGQIVGLLGPNGAGKTTSFYMVVGLVAMDKGEVSLINKTGSDAGDKQDLSKYAMHERARFGIGYLPQEASIFGKLTVADNILAILQTRKDLNKAGQQQELAKLIAEFNLNHVKDSLGMSLSGGERRRCEIARALASNPKFILLDEPFAGVDPISVGDIMEVIKTLKQRNIGVLITDRF